MLRLALWFETKDIYILKLNLWLKQTDSSFYSIFIFRFKVQLIIACHFDCPFLRGASSQQGLGFTILINKTMYIKDNCESLNATRYNRIQRTSFNSHIYISPNLHTLVLLLWWRMYFVNPIYWWHTIVLIIHLENINFLDEVLKRIMN